MGNVIIVLFLIIALLVGGIFLQIFLSKMKSKWFGLMLPTITFLYSLIIILGIAGYGMTCSDIFMLISSTFLISNIPTIILLSIYFGCREKMKIRSQLDKMNIQDLE